MIHDATKPLILHYAPDNASLVVRLALEELGCTYKTVLVDRARNAQHAQPYLALNPNGQIPVLETPDGPLFETAAILLWLADRHGKLAPEQNSPQRGLFLTWLFWVSNTLHSDVRILFYPHRYGTAETSDPAGLHQKLRERITTHLACVEAALVKSPFLTHSQDGQPTLLALYLPCLLRWLHLYPIDSDKHWIRQGTYPTLAQLGVNLEKRRSAKTAQLVEGLGSAPFTNPTLPNPPEGSAL